MDELARRIRIKLRDDFQHYALKCLKIRSKSSAITEFTLNPAQRYIHEKVEQQLRETGKVRAIILKGRQQGCSTYIEGRFYWRVTHRLGVRSFILTHDIEATNNLFEMAKRFHQFCPDVIRQSIAASNAKELIFDGLDSGYKLGTAGNKSVGRSSTIQLLHGCLAEGSLIFNPITGGLKKIEDFIIGDIVRTHTGRCASISFISTQRKECLEVVLRGLTAFPLLATPCHKFWTKDGWKKLEHFKSDDVIGYPLKVIKKEAEEFIIPDASIRLHGGGRQFVCPDSIKIDYKLGRLIGLYLAEGHIKLQNKEPNYPSAISFTIHRKELGRTIKWVAPFHKYFSSIKTEDREDCLTSVLTIYGNRFAMLINQLCGRTKGKTLPLMWHQLGYDFCKGLLHGYISGDGHSDDNCRRVRASSICPAITISLRDLAASLGYGWASIEFKAAGIRNDRNEKDRYTFSLCGDGASYLAKEIGKITPKIVNKKTKSNKKYAAVCTEISNGYAWLRVSSIMYAGMKQVYDFEVDHDDRSYCAIQGATHNSEVAYWPHAIEHAKGIMQAVPNEPGTEIFIESTANGIGNYFHEQWQRAEAGQSDFLPIFIPWFWQPEYSRKVDKDFKPLDEEQHLIDQYGLKPEQLAWRRLKIEDLSTGGIDGVKAFMQEYPCSPIEAFQTTGEDSFIAPDIVMAARKCNAEPYGGLIVGVDPARFGDDRTSIIRRRGRHAYGLQSYIKKDTMEVTGLVHRIIIEEQPFKVCIDICGLGAGIYDRLCELGHRDILVAVNAGNTPLDQKRYINKRAEMWGQMHEWLREPPCQIPDIDSLHADLCGLTYKFDSKSRLVLEKKEDAKKRGIRSPDEAEALALTFSCPDSAIMESRTKVYNQVAKNVMSGFNHIDRLKKAAYGR